MTSISKERKIQILERELGSLFDDFNAIEKTFIDHAKSKFNESFLQGELLRISENYSYIVRNVFGQVNLNVIKNKKFDYTIHLRVPSTNDGNIVKWMGSSQILMIKGKGRLKVRLLEVPCDIDINHFKKDVKLQVLEERELCGGDSISCHGPHKILDIAKIESPVVIESLTIKNNGADIFWNFDHNLKSYMAESSKVEMSRLTNILNVIIQMGATIPTQLQEAVFTHGDPYLKLKTIQALLQEGNHSAFDRIQEAVDSTNDILATGAQLILDRLISTKN